ncbi:tail fiber protein [Aquimarina brevivitae]|uniref:Uncharacterized protein n=1 Tax=Aquimarina brevivitae TaxID=323412 RepID=A0A4Q7NU25_9FLAO|nr:tail fiber protein [Aquimarina brevivitae]RZS90544.1 hypothetical protein EV197_3338 [Aquimarina brevivitae]
MKNFYLLILTIATIQLGFSQQPTYNVTAGNGNGLRFWSSDSYKIHMGNTADYKYGPVTDYSIKMNMNGSVGRGWVWGIHGVTPVAALSNEGDFQIARNFRALGNITMDGNNVSLPLNATNNDPNNYVNNYDFRIRKSNNSFYIGLSNEFNVRKVYLQSGHVASEWASGTGTISLNPFGGNVGIGTTDPKVKLHVNGSIRGNAAGEALRVQTPTGYLDLGAQNSSWAHIYTDRPKIIFNKDVHTATNAFSSYNDDLVLKTKGTERLRVDDETGNVGIGNQAPIAKLHITGDLFMNQGEGFRLFGDSSYFGQWKDGIVFEMQDANASNGSTDGGFVFRGFTPTDNISTDWMVIKSGGLVGIGTTSPDAKLTVKGNIHAEEVKIDLSVPAPDYVFTKDYDLLTIEEVQQHIAAKGHLPNVPSAKEMEAEGVELGVMNMKLLEKIEELTLYTIAQEEKLKNQEQINQELQQKNEALEERLERIESIITQNKQ